jgi:transposase
MLPGLTIDGGMTGQAFAVYVEHCLAPYLRPGQIVVMDNLRAHFHPRVRPLIEGRGAELWHLPAYSPDLNPLEEAFSPLKRHRRRAAARTIDTLCAETWAALRSVTPQDASGWFRHCGYET